MAGERDSIDPLTDLKSKRKIRGKQGGSSSKQLEEDIQDQTSISGDGVSVSMRSNIGERGNNDRSSSSGSMDRSSVGPKGRSVSLTEVDEDEQASAAKDTDYTGVSYNK